jgi:hypothetical protein
VNNLFCHNVFSSWNLDVRVALFVRIAALSGRAVASLRSFRSRKRRPQEHNLPARTGGFALGGAGDDAQHFLFAHDDEIFVVEFDLGAGVFAEQDAVALFYIEWTDLAFFADLAFANRNDLALLGLIFCGIGDDDPAARSIRLFHAPNQNPIVQWGELGSHVQTPFVSC